MVRDSELRTVKNTLIEYQTKVSDFETEKMTYQRDYDINQTQFRDEQKKCMDLDRKLCMQTTENDNLRMFNKDLKVESEELRINNS